MISDTINQAAERFGVPVEHFTKGGFWKYRKLTRAREWVVSQHSDLSTVALAEMLGYSDHTAIVRMRARMVGRDVAPPLPCGL